MDASFTMKQGDTLPAMIGTLSDAVGVVDLTLASSVFLHVVHASTGVVVVNAACTVVNAVGGKVSYAWQSADTAVAGDFEFEFLVTWSNGAMQRFPNTTTNLRLRIEDKLA